MSIEAKKMLAHDISNKLGGVLTENDKNTVLAILSEELSDYKLEYEVQSDYDTESEEFLNSYIEAKRIEGRSEKTLERYGYIINRTIKTIGVPIRKLTVFHIRKYFASEKDRGISDRTLEGNREVLSAFFGWLHKEGLLQSNPIANLGSIKYAKVIRLPYSNEEIERLKEHCKTDRDKAIVMFLLSTGCRISEVCALNRSDIDFINKECTVLGKGNKERTVFLDDVTIMFLQRYIGSRNDKLDALFVGKGSTRLTPHGVRNMLKGVSERAGVDNTHPHRFRRTLATNLISHGMPIQEVATLLGHERLDTTMTYTHIDKSTVANSYRKYM